MRHGFYFSYEASDPLIFFFAVEFHVRYKLLLLCNSYWKIDINHYRPTLVHISSRTFFSPPQNPKASVFQ